MDECVCGHGIEAHAANGTCMFEALGSCRCAGYEPGGDDEEATDDRDEVTKEVEAWTPLDDTGYTGEDVERGHD